MPLKEDVSPCIFGPIEKERWSYACAKQLIERVIYGQKWFKPSKVLFIPCKSYKRFIVDGITF